MHAYLLRHMAAENRGQCLDKCTAVGRTRVGGHETRPKPKPNVDYYLVSYLLLLFLLFDDLLVSRSNAGSARRDRREGSVGR